MGLPSIDIVFRTQGTSAVKRGDRGVVAIVMRDDYSNGLTFIYGESDIPSNLSNENKGIIKRALIGGVKPPKKIVLYVLPTEVNGSPSPFTNAYEDLETVAFDYITFPEDVTAEECTSITTWIKKCREDMNKKIKAVLPNHKADYEGVINFTTTNIKVGDVVYTAGDYCSRIAGLIAGTPLNISATYQPLPEVMDVVRFSKSEMDDKINKGEFILFNDGEKVKVGRAVNSYTTLIQGKGEDYKKIKFIDTIDLIATDIRKTSEDNYIGKFANSYDNKCLLLIAINTYLDQLLLDGLLDKRATNVCYIDIEKQRVYLKSLGVDVAGLSDNEIKVMNTKDKVFLGANIKILDAIEEISLDIIV